MQYKSVISPAKISGRTVTGIASVFGVTDSDGDILHPGAFRKTLQENSRRLKFLWQHNYTEPPIAVIDSVREISAAELPGELRETGATGGLEVTRTYLDTIRGNEALEAIRSGAVTEMSIGFNSVKFEYEKQDSVTVCHIREVRLWEISDVLWGANELTVASKSAVPFRSTGTDPDRIWSAPTLSDFTDESFDALDTTERKRISDHFAWAATYPAEKFGDLKLPHHVPSKTGIGKAVWNGVRAAMGALMGARGGVDIPEGDFDDVYNHLAKHYSEFGKTPPERKVALWNFLTAKMLREDRFNSSYKDSILAVMRLLSAEPTETSLTADELKQRIRIAERILGL